MVLILPRRLGHTSSLRLGKYFTATHTIGNCPFHNSQETYGLIQQKDQLKDKYQPVLSHMIAA
ncbi:hypothetical protein H5410_017680 [Solanum commersonii]|uniref:Uncharacterized protein n=1 Tax=Solanum commersonii TaxID=4109 RepID=A0A9J6A063_SOLCO|nr:hypothetical protein H5410_017680 [Solanum commersonii]